MSRRLTLLLAVPIAAALAVTPTLAREGGGASGEHAGGNALLKFDTMAAVVEPWTGPAHAIRGVPGGGLPWELDRADGELRRNGRLDVRVEGLVLARRAPVPPAVQGTNPIAQFRGAVNCLTPASPDIGQTVFTDPVPASPEGDARIRATLDLPEPCVAPIVFVTSPTGAWFATTGR